MECGHTVTLHGKQRQCVLERHHDGDHADDLLRWSRALQSERT